MRGPVAIVVCLAALAVAGCGGGKDNAPGATAAATTSSVTVAQTAAAPAAVTGFAHVAFADVGVSFDRPKGWSFQRGTGEQLATISSGDVTIAVWRYPRTGHLPTTPSETATAAKDLVKAAKSRDPSLKVTKSKGTRAAHHPAVVIVADETVAGQPRIVRSTHVYAEGAELVIDAFAPPSIFPKVEGPVFRKVVRTLRIVAPPS